MHGRPIRPAQWQIAGNHGTGRNRNVSLEAGRSSYRFLSMTDAIWQPVPFLALESIGKSNILRPIQSGIVYGLQGRTLWKGFGFRIRERRWAPMH